jgi:DNA polymerase III sliding clamp (beta) subunit (PCNA family)
MFRFTINASDWADLVTAAAFAGTDLARPILMGVFFEITRTGDEVTVKAIATDSYKLATIERGGTTYAGESNTLEGIADGETVTALISAKGLTAASKAAIKDAGKNGGLRVTVDPEHGRAVIAGYYGTSLEYPAELVDGTYPAISNAIPADSFYLNSNGVTGIGLNPHFVGLFAKLAPWSAKSPTDSARFEFIDESRPIRVASRDGRTKAYLMPVRVM